MTLEASYALTIRPSWLGRFKGMFIALVLAALEISLPLYDLGSFQGITGIAAALLFLLALASFASAVIRHYIVAYSITDAGVVKPGGYSQRM